MKKRLMKLIRVFVVMCILFTVIGCGKAKITGKWTSQGQNDIKTLELKDDGTGVIDYGEDLSKNCTYTVKDDKLVITVNYLGTDDVKEYTYKLEKNKLELSTGTENIVYTK